MHSENIHFQVFEFRFSVVFLSNSKHIVDNRHKSMYNCRNQPPGVSSLNVTHLKTGSPRLLWEWSVKHLGEYMNKVHFKCIADPHVGEYTKTKPQYQTWWNMWFKARPKKWRVSWQQGQNKVWLSILKLKKRLNEGDCGICLCEKEIGFSLLYI